MRIVDVCAFYSTRGGGVKTYIRQKLSIGRQLGHDVTVLAPGDRYAVEEVGPDARIVTLPSPRFPLDRNYWYFADEPALHRELDRLEPDFVEVSSPWRSPVMVKRWKADVPRSLILHADPLSAYAYRWLQRFLSPAQVDRRLQRYWNHLRDLGGAFDRVVCASADLGRRMAAGGVPNVTVCPMGVEPELFDGTNRDEALRRDLLARCALGRDAHLLVGVGRLAPEKRWPMIIEAVTAAGTEAPIALAMFGEGRERHAILRAIAGNPHIRLFEPVTDRLSFARLLASADALVHGCEAETFCMVAAEARASQVPIIVPDRGGAADHAGEGSAVYGSGSGVDAARAILECLRTPKPQGSVGVRTTHDHFRDLFADYERLVGKLRLAA